MLPSALLSQDTIDVTVPNDFSFQVNSNTPISQYNITIKKNDTSSTQVYSTGNITLSPPIYATNSSGEAQRITRVIASGVGMTNGNAYKWTATVSDGSTTVTSPETPFFAKAAPTLSLVVPATLTVKSREFVGTYTGTPVKYFRFVLKNITQNTIIKDTGDIYSQDIRTLYDGFLTDYSYSIQLIVTNQDNITKETYSEFYIDYDAPTVSGFVELEKMQSHSAVRVAWNPTIIQGTPIGGGPFNFINESGYWWLEILKGNKVSFSTVNNQQMKFPSSVTHILKFKIEPGNTDVNHTVYKAFGKLGIQDYFIEIVVKNYQPRRKTPAFRHGHIRRNR